MSALGYRWAKRPGPGHPTCGASWQLHHNGRPVGPVVRHCGHPTALWPYTVELPDGVTLIHHSEHAYPTLAEAQEDALRVAVGLEPYGVAL